MKILSSAISMSGKSSLVENHTKDESLKTWVGNKRPDFEGRGKIRSGPSKLQMDILELSEKAKKSLEKMKKEALSGVQETGESAPELTDKERMKIQAIIEMLERLTGKRVRIMTIDLSKLKSSNVDMDFRHPVSEGGAQQTPAGWGLEYDSHERYYEKQEMSFSSQGVIQTADGKRIDFSMNLTMSREFAASQDIRIREGDAVKIDPLVINYGGSAASLTDTKFSFDLDNDGKPDQISFAGPGSGFLALDLNGDGKINNGSELFGPQSGNGFTELAKYDSDGNQWIDENDPIFEKLRIWTKDENGKDTLFALGQKGIGAIYLGNVDTQFSIKDSNNTSQGDIQRTGIFVRENGSVGTIQHIDLAI